MLRRGPALIVHGGAGLIPSDTPAIRAERVSGKINGMKRALQAGYACLRDPTNENVLDAVEIAIRVMDDDEAFNTGRGSVLTQDGQVEQDALIIKGSNLKAGAVGAIRHVAHPITVARLVMEKTDHAFLAGSGAEDFARSQGVPLISNEELVTPRARAHLERILSRKSQPSNELGGGTVGAVAINSKGELAAATSTGGMGGKLPGRVGDTPIIGGGTFCDDEVCGVSATGMGEAIMRACLSSRIANHIEQGQSASDACKSALQYMTSKIPEGDGGAIAIAKTGEVGFSFNSEVMAWAYVQNGELHYGVDKDEHIIEIFDEPECSHSSS